MEKTRIINEQPAQSFPLQWIEDNQDNFINGAFVKDWVLAPKYTGNFLKPLWNGIEYYESATPEEIAQHNLSQLSQKETELYLKRMQDGQIMYAEISAEFRLAKLSGTITEEQHGAIEDTLIPVRNEVLAGQWISALQKLEAIGVVIGSELYQRLHTQITNYINENY